jgi:hypothetical protein
MMTDVFLLYKIKYHATAELRNLRYSKQHKRSYMVSSTADGLAFALCDCAGFLAIQLCCDRSYADGRASWLSSNVRCKKSCASGEISDGIEGLADDPI